MTFKLWLLPTGVAWYFRTKLASQQCDVSVFQCQKCFYLCVYVCLCVGVHISCNPEAW